MSSQARHWLVFGLILLVTFVLALVVAGNHQRYALSRAPSSFVVSTLIVPSLSPFTSGL